MHRPDQPNRALRPTLYTLLLATVLLVLGPMVGLSALAQPGDADAKAEQDKPEQPEKPKTLTEQFGGDDRYLTHLATDKPIYRAGETVYVRGTILHAFDRTPIDDKQQEIEALNEQINVLREANKPENREAINELSQQRWQLQRQNNLSPMVEIKDPKGAVVSSSRAQVQDSVIGFKWDVPEGQAGGEYTVKVSYPGAGLAPAERTFDIRAYRAPRIKTQIDFMKDGYGPGDTVVATVDAERAEGGIPEGAKVTAIARVDGSEVGRVETMVRETGSAVARFVLPGQIERGEGSVTFVIDDNGTVESASKTLPILLQTLDLEIYPEGGDLVAGVENRVYFEAKTPYGKPADVRGFIYPIIPDVGQSDFSVGDFQTTHEGRGVFRFEPRADWKYVFVVKDPSSITQTFELPKAEPGLAMAFQPTVLKPEQPLRITVRRSNEQVARHCSVVVRQREKVVWPVKNPANVEFPRQGSATFPLIQGVAQPGVDINRVDFAVDLPADVSGVLTVTLYDGDGTPVAERLIYRAPKNQVNIEIMPDSAQYTPAGQVQLTIKTTDQDGNPVSAVAGLTVTDDAVLEMIETREQAPNLPAMVLLEPEVDDLADAHVYLDPENPEAAQQLDLLLGTQGWRRFALVNLEDFIAEHGDDARRMLALRKQTPREAWLEERGLVRFAMPMPAAEAALGVDQLKAADAQVAEDGAAQPPAPPAQPLDLDRALQAGEAKQAEEAILAEPAADARRAPRPPQMVFVREYAHDQPDAKPIGQRSDFTETVYWSSATKTNEEGVATVSFDLSDSVTSFRVKADAFTKAGALGANSALIESVQPFYVEPKLPLEVTAGDKVLLPIGMVNNTDRELPVELLVSKLGRSGDETLDPITLGADTRGRTIYELAIGQTFGDLPFTIQATAGRMMDINKRKLRVVPKGFPINDGSGGMLSPDSEQTDELIIPDTVVPGSLSAHITVYPTPLANLTEALEALIREPYGCFEQTSSTTFPLVMAQQYFLTHQGVPPEVMAAAREKLDKGYQRLIGFETEKDGFEWFGATPPHEALTAYGLLQFNEMKQVMDVDQKMIDRTTDWLMSRMDDDGSFKLDSKALDSFGRAPQDTTNAYIVWSLLEAGYDPAKIQKSIDLVLGKALNGDDAYIVALGANIAAILAEANGDPVAPRSDNGAPVTYGMMLETLLTKLANKLNDEGFIDGAVTSITNSGGDALKIETTSLAILAWLRDDEYTEQVEQSILWLTERCKAGRFGSTQSTVLALKAIVEYDKARSTPKAPGSLVVTVDGEQVGEPVAFDKETKGAIALPAIASHLTPGKHTIAVKMTDGSKMPYSIAVDYFADTPASSEECKLRISTRLNVFQRADAPAPTVTEGETTEVNVKVSNITKDGLPTPIAIVGLPGGLEPDYDQLKELVEAGTIASFEVIGRDVVLYWRELKPEQVVDLSIRCTAAVPGTYTGPASRTYLYYTDEHKQWADGLVVKITPAAQ